MSPLLLPLVPLAGAAAVALLRRRAGALGPLAVGVLIATLLLASWAALTEPVTIVEVSSAVALSIGVRDFGRVMVVLVPAIALPVISYAAVTEKGGRARLLALMLAFVAAMVLLVVANDFVTLLVGWELVGAISWALIGHDWHDRANVDAATQAFLTTRVGDLGLYLAAGAAFAATGGFDFADVAGAGSPWREIIAGGVLLAAAAKSAQVPFSPWLFEAMAGPTPVSALLHSATLVASGAYLLIRLAPALAPVPWFLPAVALVGIVTALAGGFLAIIHRHAKRVLAASTSAQYGLMFVAIGAGSTAAAGAQLVTHAAFKSLLFLAAGMAIHAAGTADLGRFRLGRALPAVAVASGVGAFALAGIPPLGAAWSKEAILAAAVEASGVLGVATIAAGLLSTIYAGRFQLLAFGAGGEVREEQRRPSRVVYTSLALLAAATIALSALWLPAAKSPVEAFTRGELAAGAPWELVSALAALGTGAAIVLITDRRGRLLDPGIGTDRYAVLENWLGLPQLTHALVVRPVLALSAVLARADDRLIDAGVRATAYATQLVSALTARHLELSIDGVVHGIAAWAIATAGVSRLADDRGVDAAVEAAGRGVGLAGHLSRRLQTGLSHEYFVIGAVGLVAITVVLATGR